ncbi:unnamed protein product [Adineta steineri]|uniref:Uncharacterized protein n=1 Tax=Adineta steineri TaxID=433720 RepID=A0A815CJ88_9BILA|nr:unnamed protein product [Adineta steineri]CAF1284774.1 unnamed protein product [Adineta steineri]
MNVDVEICVHPRLTTATHPQHINNIHANLLKQRGVLNYHHQFREFSYFRRKYILFTEGLVERTCPYNDKINIDCVRSIEIRLEKVIENCATYFPNITELKISSMNINQNEIFNSLQYILPLQQLTTLLINDPKCNLEKMIELLHYLPKLSSLTIQHILIHENDLVCIQ